MTALTSAIAKDLANTLGQSPSPVPLVTGACGAGRTSVLLHLRDVFGPERCQYVDVERVATTPERFLQALVVQSPFRAGPHTSPANVRGPREAFDAFLAFVSSACTNDNVPATFLLDEVLDLRTFESFPGLRSVMAELVQAIESSPNRFVFATRFASRAGRLASNGGRLKIFQMPRLSVQDVRDAIEAARGRRPAAGVAAAFSWGWNQNGAGPVADDRAAHELSQTVHALTDGRPCYVRTLLEGMQALGNGVAPDPLAALVATMSEGGALAVHCRFSYELRLHRARGYGALKAILEVLAAEEPLTLTAIAQRLCRTPGSTKDYLSWLEDVDLVGVERKQYRVTDPLLRLWIRLHARPLPPTPEAVVAEVQRYAMLRLAGAARVSAMEAAAAQSTAPTSVAPATASAPTGPPARDQVAEPVGVGAGAPQARPHPRASEIDFD